MRANILFEFIKPLANLKTRLQVTVDSLDVLLPKNQQVAFLQSWKTQSKMLIPNPV